MRVYILLLLVIGCRGIDWKPINDAKETFKVYSVAAVNTISSIENILETFKLDSELFLKNTFFNNPVLNRITEMRLPYDKCFLRFIDKDNLKFSFENQTYQLQIPLRMRIVDIREKSNKINSSIDIYRWLAESKYQSCLLLNEGCLEKTNEWLKSTIRTLSCTIHLNCDDHSIKKRSSCSAGQFACKHGKCITSSLFCDGECNCGECSDEPDDCARVCSEFRCGINFRCILNSKKCNGIDDCGDGTDEEGCRHTTMNKPSYLSSNCSIDVGKFLCRTTKCIGLEQVCDGHNDCGDWSDEDECCKGELCCPQCGRKGGVCFTGSTGFECLHECPSGTYETFEGCSPKPENPFATLSQILEDTRRLTTRYAARVTHLKTTMVEALSKSLHDVLKCKKQEYTSLFNDIGSLNSEVKKIFVDGSFMNWRARNEENETGKEDPISTSTETTITPTIKETTMNHTSLLMATGSSTSERRNISADGSFMTWRNEQNETEEKPNRMTEETLTNPVTTENIAPMGRETTTTPMNAETTTIHTVKETIMNHTSLFTAIGSSMPEVKKMSAECSFMTWRARNKEGTISNNSKTGNSSNIEIFTAKERSKASIKGTVTTPTTNYTKSLITTRPNQRITFTTKTTPVRSSRRRKRPTNRRIKYSKGLSTSSQKRRIKK